MSGGGPSTDEPVDATACAGFEALGTTVVVVVTGASSLDGARQVVEEHVQALDRAASRFRPDSDLSRVNAASGRPVMVSDLFLTLLEEGLDAARATGGAVVPTAGEALRLLGYDRTFTEVEKSGAALRARVGPVPGWQAICVDHRDRVVTVPAGVRLDLGATAKASCADRAAAEAASCSGAGVLVSLGGDIAVAGEPPSGGWRIRVADRHDAPPSSPGVTVSLSEGGIATSGTAARRWRRGGQVLHHLIDPVTGQPAASRWRTVTVAAETCLRANTASTAAMVLGEKAVAWLESTGLAARLVAEDGEVLALGDWPADAVAAR